MPILMSALRAYALAVLLAVSSAAVAIMVVDAFNLPLRDPDGFLGPAYFRLPVIVLMFVVTDVVPRAVFGRRNLVEVLRERYSPERAALVVVGLGAFYLSYVSYRNLKGALPFARPRVLDGELLALDRIMAFGNDPAVLLHGLLGTGVAAYALSAVYLFYLGFVPLSLGAALVWGRNVQTAAWYVTALCLNWLLGALSYYLVPSLGPVFVRPNRYADLPVTGVTALQEKLATTRLEVLFDPTGAEGLAGVAGFASLHVSVVFTAALVAHRIGMHHIVRSSLWVFLALTMIATAYFGWHYLIDIPAGLALGAGAVALAGRATRTMGVVPERVALPEAAQPLPVGSGAATR